MWFGWTTAKLVFSGFSTFGRSPRKRAGIHPENWRIILFRLELAERAGFEPCLLLWNQLIADNTMHSIQQKQQKLNLAVHASVQAHPLTPLRLPPTLLTFSC